MTIFGLTNVVKPVFLAPMAGVNDPAFRAICKRMGADMTYSEMVSAKGLEYGNQKTADMLQMLDAEKPITVQLFGKEAASLAEQARAIEANFGADVAVIDINMACPARKIAGKGEGAALMREPKLAEAILTAVVEAVKLPVSVKFRKGYELGECLALDFARMAESCGVAAMAVHGRYAKQFYSGEADRRLLAEVKAAVAVPVIASGDVFSTRDIDYYFEQCGVDAVMVARGARGNPWIFADRTPSIKERVDTAAQHASLLFELMPQRLPSMRKHIAWYFKGTPAAAAIRREVNNCHSLEDYLQLLDGVLSCS